MGLPISASPGLKTSNRAAYSMVKSRFGEAGHSQAQLPRIGYVLGVVDHCVAASRQGQGDVERAGFRARLARRRDQDVDIAWNIDGAQSLRRFAVVCLEHELDVEFRGGIIEPREGLNEPGNDALLPIKGCDDRVDGQVRVLDAECTIFGLDRILQECCCDPENDHAEKQWAHEHA
jgi:hypothetical protein